MLGSHSSPPGHRSSGLLRPCFWSISLWVKWVAGPSSMNVSEYPLVPTRLYHHWWQVSWLTRYSTYPQASLGMSNTRSSISTIPPHSLPFQPK